MRHRVFDWCGSLLVILSLIWITDIIERPDPRILGIDQMFVAAPCMLLGIVFLLISLVRPRKHKR